jgi:hypothetical protein
MAMITYKHLTLGETINALEAMDPNTSVVGLHGQVESYRGYYQHVALEPGPYSIRAERLAQWLTEQVGGTMSGWKGGDYPIKEDCYVFLAHEGNTGPGLGGFVYTGTHTAEPVGLIGGGYLL